jgi:hypothetical protein
LAKGDWRGIYSPPNGKNLWQTLIFIQIGACQTLQDRSHEVAVKKL